MRQRVALARALAQDSSVLLMDEPFAALDAITRDNLHEELTRVWQEQNIAVVFVTHNVREAVRLGQRVVLMGSRPGRIVREWEVDGRAAAADRVPGRRRAGRPDHHPAARGDQPPWPLTPAPRSGRARPTSPPGWTPSRPRSCGRSGAGRPRAVAGRFLPPLVAVAVLVGIWQVAYLMDLKPSYALPSPLDTFTTFTGLLTDGRAWNGVTISVSRGFIGFGMSLVVGTLLGLAMWQFSLLRRAIGPAVSGLLSLPSVAWVPAAIIWFQLTDAAIYTVVLLGAVPSIANGLLAGFDQVPPLYSRVGRVLGLSAWGRVRHVMLPAALPGYISGLKQGWAFAWRSLMAAELITYSPALGHRPGPAAQHRSRAVADGPGHHLDLPDLRGGRGHRAARLRPDRAPRAEPARSHRRQGGLTVRRPSRPRGSGGWVRGPPGPLG